MKLYKKPFLDCLAEYQQLVSQVDEKAFEKIYNYYHKKLIAFSRNYPRSKELDEEVYNNLDTESYPWISWSLINHISCGTALKMNQYESGII